MGTLGTTYGIRPEILAAHRATWSAYAGGWGVPTERVPKTASMRGRWAGYDVACSCGWDSATGGAILPRVEEALWDHRMDAQIEADAAAKTVDRTTPSA